MEDEEIKKLVQEGYTNIVKTASSCCTPNTTYFTSKNSCCGTSGRNISKVISKNIGYSELEVEGVPEGANLGLGCGNPIGMASILEGETVLDLGCGAGFDCFLASKKVGETGRVIGIDMTPDMISKARENAKQGNFPNVEFRLGEIENLPVEKNSIDLVISNCVINLVPNKARAFQEAFRVLKPEGKLMISDIVLRKELPELIINSMEAYIACVSGAILKQDYIKSMEDAGFKDINILEESSFPIDGLTITQMNIPSDELKRLTSSVVSVKIEGKKPLPQLTGSKSLDKLKVDIYVPLETCSCLWDNFMNLVFEVIAPYKKIINFNTKNINSVEARENNIHGNCVLVDGKHKFTTSFALKNRLPELLKEKGLI